MTGVVTGIRAWHDGVGPSIEAFVGRQRSGSRPGVAAGEFGQQRDGLGDAGRRPAGAGGRPAAGQPLSARSSSAQSMAVPSSRCSSGRHRRVQPLPQLGAGDLGGGGVFHQPVDRHAAVAVQPGGQVAHADFDVALEAGAGDGAGRRLRSGRRGRRARRRAARGAGWASGMCASKIAARHRDQRRVRDPGAVVAGGDFAQLVGAHPRHRRVVGGGIAG